MKGEKEEVKRGGGGEKRGKEGIDRRERKKR